MIPKTMNFLRSVLDQVKADECELVFEKSHFALTRFMKNYVHQSTHTHTRALTIRVVVDGRIGTFTTDRFDQDSVTLGIQRAKEIAAVLPVAPRALQLPQNVQISDISAGSEFTAKAMPYDRAHLLELMVREAEKCDAKLSGAISTSENTMCVLNTRGTDCYQEYTIAEFNLLAERNGLTGYSYWVGHDFSAIPSQQLLAEALRLATSTLPVVSVEPKPTTVILDHYAVGTIADFLAYEGFGAKGYLEGTSFMATKRGKQVCSPRFTMWDDGRNDSGLKRLFDYEGMPKSHVSLVENGVAKDVVTDSSTAIQSERPNTGHAGPLPNTEGPLPTNLFIQGGSGSLEGMIANTENGIYVRKFHYVNTVEPMQVMLTGMTKDGTYLIKDGKLANPVTNLRFTESALKAFSSIRDISSETRLTDSMLGSTRVPAMKISEFSFTGTSEQ